ncbi:hypothetical protein R6Q59_015760 [Mikania micrantha]
MSSGSDAEGYLAEHPILQFLEGSTAFGRCAKFRTMRIGRQKAIDWDVLTEIGERERAKRGIGEETPWRRLFEMAFQPSYREVVVEFLSTFTFRPGGVPKVVFSMLRQRHEMSLAEFAVITGLYWEPETVNPLYTAGITEIDDATLRAWWPHIADDPFGGTKARVMDAAGGAGVGQGGEGAGGEGDDGGLAGDGEGGGGEGGGGGGEARGPHYVPQHPQRRYHTVRLPARLETILQDLSARSRVHDEILQDLSTRSREHDRILSRQSDMLRWMIDREIERSRQAGAVRHVETYTWRLRKGKIVMDAISIIQNLPPPIDYNRISPSNCRRFSSRRNRISAVDEVSAITYDPLIRFTSVCNGLGYPVFDFEIAAGVAPFVVAGIEFSKRIVAQKKCIECGGSGLVLIEKEYIRCPNCGGFLPWQSWKRFFSTKVVLGSRIQTSKAGLGVF